MRYSLLATGLMALVLIVGRPADPVAANGSPIKIVLSYLSGVSNWGPSNATGVAELVMGEGEVRLTATGLAPLAAGEEYYVWIVNSAGRERMALGSFQPAEGGIAKLDKVMNEPIPERAWDLMLLSVEREGSEPMEPSNRHSIAGRFPAPSGSEGRPAQLPNTGGAEDTDVAGRIWPQISLVALLAVLLSVLVGFGLGRVSSRSGAERKSR